MTQLVLPPGGDLHRIFSRAAERRRIVFIAGIPAVGKSLFVQQLALLATRNDRELHLLQWDVARKPFEMPPYDTRYPLNDGVTQPFVGQAVGLWVREAVTRWHENHADDNHILIGELPLIGNRLIELTQVLGDEAEDILTSDEVEFLLPVPSREVRTHIESARHMTVTRPMHEREKDDAQPKVVASTWLDVRDIAVDLGADVSEDVGYDPAVYEAAYRHLLQHRHHEVVPVEEILPKVASVYELGVDFSELEATADEVRTMFHRLESQR